MDWMVHQEHFFADVERTAVYQVHGRFEMSGSTPRSAFIAMIRATASVARGVWSPTIGLHDAAGVSLQERRRSRQRSSSLRESINDRRYRDKRRKGRPENLPTS
ncbi:MAG: hypothetical protein U5R30_14995 [Deltaproteobacteria bacterium]|nr:hypothetical protein [Deltaproteobacteria bacterium]